MAEPTSIDVSLDPEITLPQVCPACLGHLPDPPEEAFVGSLVDLWRHCAACAQNFHEFDRGYRLRAIAGGALVLVSSLLAIAALALLEIPLKGTSGHPASATPGLVLLASSGFMVVCLRRWAGRWPRPQGTVRAGRSVEVVRLRNRVARIRFLNPEYARRFLAVSPGAREA